MISKTLLKQTIRNNIVLWAVLTGIQILMVAGVASAGTSLQQTALAYYNMLPGLISAIYVIITGNKLLAQQVDKGTMAYVLSNPIKRSKVAVTQTVFFLGSLIVMFALSAAAHCIAHYLGLGSITATEVGHVALLNLGLFCLNAALSGICFLASCVFNLSKYAIAVGGGIVGAQILMSIMGMFGETFRWMRNFTLVTLFDINSVLSSEPGSSDFIWKYIVLAAVGVVTYAIGSALFSKRDLPL
jgi:ABC-2 type transport system permease protein